MTSYNFLSQSVIVSYKAKLFSIAAFIYVIGLILNILLPLIVVYRSDGLWKKEDIIHEQPNVEFKHQLIAVLESRNESEPLSNNLIFWSTFLDLNNVFDNNQYRIPTIAVSPCFYGRFIQFTNILHIRRFIILCSNRTKKPITITTENMMK